MAFLDTASQTALHGAITRLHPPAMTSTSFGAAQQRVLTRRKERALTAQARLQYRNQAPPSTVQGHLPESARGLWASIAAKWNTISGVEGTRPAFRVGQVDAELLDEELLDLLYNQVGDALKFYGTHVRDDYAAEIMLALRAVLFKLTIWDRNASYGASLQNLRYTDARDKSSVPVPPKKWQKTFYGLASVGGRYAWTKWQDYLLDTEGGYQEPTIRIRLLSRITSLLTSAHSIAAVTSFLFFLVNGKYRTLLDRLFRLRLVPTTNQVHHEVSFEYLNRQLVWHAFTEFLLFLLPLIGVQRWRRWLGRTWRKSRFFFRKATDEPQNTEPSGELGFLPERRCAICYQEHNPSNPDGSGGGVLGANSGVVGSAQTDITNPYETIPCGCIYCFVCIAQRLEAEDGEGWTCLRCGEIVTQCQPWSGDVLNEPRSRSSSGKSVSFADEATTGASFVELDPTPLEDDHLGRIEAHIEEDLEREVSGSMKDSDMWDSFPRSTPAAHAFVTEEGELMDNEYENDAVSVVEQNISEDGSQDSRPIT